MNQDTFHAVLDAFLNRFGSDRERASRENYWVFEIDEDEFGLSVTNQENGSPSVGRFFTLVTELDNMEALQTLTFQLLDLNNELPFVKLYVPADTTAIGLCCDFPVSEDLNPEVLEAWAQMLVQSLYQVRETLFPEEQVNFAPDLPPGGV